MQSQALPSLQLRQFLSETISVLLPKGAHLPGWIGRFSEKSPIAVTPNAAAMCKGPVEAAIKPPHWFINAMYCESESLPVKFLT